MTSKPIFCGLLKGDSESATVHIFYQDLRGGAIGQQALCGEDKDGMLYPPEPAISAETPWCDTCTAKMEQLRSEAETQCE